MHIMSCQKKVIKIIITKNNNAIYSTQYERYTVCQYNNIHTNADSKSAKENQVLIYICIHYVTDASRDKYISKMKQNKKKA